MVDMEITDVLYTKIIGLEYEEDGAPFLGPKARGGGGMVVSRCVEARFKEIVG